MAMQDRPIKTNRSRRIAIAAVHHVRVKDQNYTGGAEKHVRTAICALLEAGASVHVGYSGSSIYDELLDRWSPDRLSVENVGWVDVCLSGDSRFRWGTFLDRRRWLRSTGAGTFFVVQQAGGTAFLTSLLAARSLGMRVVASIRQLPESLPVASGKRWLGVVPSPEFWRRRLIRRRKLVGRLCHQLIFNSAEVASSYARIYGWPENRMTVIPNGERASDEPRSNAHWPPRTIGTVGRVTEAKGADTLLEAFALIAAARPELRLAYYGDGPLIPILRDRAARLGVSDRIEFAGYRATHEEIYPNIDIYVQPSRRESMSNSVVEAMARGIPCVVTDVGGLPEQVIDRESGIVVPRDAPDRCAAALTALLEDRGTYSRLGHAGWQRAQREFDLDTTRKRLVSAIIEGE